MTTPNTCTDPHCGAHSHIMVRGRRFTGIVLNSKAQKTATIEWTRRRYTPKFERYEVRRSRITAHNPQCIDAQPGDVVELGETRKISKTKSFVILKKVGVELEVIEKEGKRYEAVGKRRKEETDEKQ
ncbi:30S ribosomal protein S17 [Candidatus Woesearchaeota archaeon]|nr:30S ribosomal protein S17 [Candidatus Woesearchaeota archaeon]